MSHVFISYSTKNSQYASRLADSLRTGGFDVWIDNAKLRSSDNWWESIVYALRNCAAFIVIMTPEARESRWVQREVTLADNWQKRIFPLLLSGENWEIFVLTQFRDVQNGQLPPQEFFDKLAEAAPRQQGRGRIVTPQARSRRPIADDAALRDAIANPPEVRQAPRRSGEQSRGCSPLRLVRRTVIAMLMLVALYLLIVGPLPAILDQFFGSPQPPSINREQFDSPREEELGPGAYFEWGMQALERGDPDEAIANFDVVLFDYNPEDANAYFHRGIAYQMRDELEAAINDFENAYQYGYEPRAEVTFHLANSYASIDQPDPAIRFALETVDYDEWNLDAWYLAAALGVEAGGYGDDPACWYLQYLEHGGPADGYIQERIDEQGLGC